MPPIPAASYGRNRTFKNIHVALESERHVIVIAAQLFHLTIPAKYLPYNARSSIVA